MTKNLDEMRAEVAEAARHAVLAMAGAWVESAWAVTQELRDLVGVASERLVAEQENSREELEQALELERQRLESEQQQNRATEQVRLTRDLLRDLTQRRQCLLDEQAKANPVERLLLALELRDVVAEQTRLLMAAGVAGEQAQAATALPAAKEALPAPKTEEPCGDEPNGTAAKPNGNGKGRGKKVTAAKE
jgi:hypothetical protein